MAKLRALIGRFNRWRRGGSASAISREILEARRKTEADETRYGGFGGGSSS
jgi:hypothetical protein